MGFMSTAANDGDRIDAMGADNPITELTADGLFSGTGGAVARGVIGGAAAVGRLAYDALSGINKSTELTYDPSANVQQTMADQSTASPQMDEALKATQEWSKIDPRTAGVGAQTLGSLAHGATVFGLGTLAGGPVAGAATMGATEGYNDYRDSVAAGVDPTTAMEKATATGLFAAAGAALPFKFGAAGIKGLVASVAGGASVNTGFGVANRFLSSEILDANGYSDMAKQYRPLDQQSMLADAVLGAAFGGFAHLTHGSEAPAAARPTDDMVEQALDARRQDAVTRAGPGIPIDPEHSTLDGDLQDRALGNLLRGKPADITSDEASAMVEHTIVDPERVQLHNDYQDANLVVHGDIADFSEPARVEAEPTPYALNDAGEPITKPEAPEGADSVPVTGGAEISPMQRVLESTVDSLQKRVDEATQSRNSARDAMHKAELARVSAESRFNMEEQFQKGTPNPDRLEAAKAKLYAAVGEHERAKGVFESQDTSRNQIGEKLVDARQQLSDHVNRAEIAAKAEQKKADVAEQQKNLAASKGATISPIHSEQLNQLALRHPDMDVEGPDGNTIKARDLPQALADHAAQAASESKLHDVAMACFMRTM